MQLKTEKKLSRASLIRRLQKRPDLLQYVLKKSALNRAFNNNSPLPTTSTAHTSTTTTTTNEQDKVTNNLIPSARINHKKTTTTRKKVQAKKVKLVKKLSTMSSAISSIISNLPVLDDNSYTSDEEDEVISRTTTKVVPSPTHRPALRPSSAARRPSYLAMVKTAVRDLIPYKMTHREGIAKYIEIRYGVSNCKVLRHALKWMLDMKVLKKKGCLYFFTSGSVDKSCIMPMSRERSPSSKRQCAPAPGRRRGNYKCHYLNVCSDDDAVPYKNNNASSSRPQRKSRCPPSKRQQRCPPRRRRTASCGPRRGVAPSRRSRRGGRPSTRRKRRAVSCQPKRRCKQPTQRCSSSKRHPMCRRKSCACYSALNKKADKVKVGTRCIQKGGKYYMQSIYV